jgi:hypothetical protein
MEGWLGALRRSEAPWLDSKKSYCRRQEDDIENIQEVERACS